MKKRIVLWGSKNEDEKCLLALELKEKENKVNLFIFPEKIATEDFYNQLMNLWREENEVPFPEGHETIERDLSITDDLLPENVKVDRSDLILRAKAEWHFVVLSSKLYEIYNSELEDLKEKVDEMKEYDDAVWEEMKAFWSKVQEQVYEKNIFREHADTLKKKTNKVFDRLKDLKKILDQRFREESRERAAEFKERLKKVEQKIEEGLGLKPIFEELKKMQSEFQNTEFTRKDRRLTWEYLDSLFKKVKQKKFGDGKRRNKNATDRITKRYEGLLNAINKMERSIKRDISEQEFQHKRIAETDGQLEAQIRQAKLKMIEERVKSKQIKLDDMYKTRKELEQRMEKIRVKEEAKKAQQEAKEKIKEKKKEAKEKIAEKMASQSDIADEEAKKLEKAAEKINKSKKKPGKESLLSAVTEAVGESLEDVVDTVKAVADVVGDKIDDAKEEYQLRAKEKKEKAEAEDASQKEGGEEEKASLFDSISDAVEDAIEDVTEAVKKASEAVEDKVEEVKENIKERAEANKKAAEKKAAESGENSPEKTTTMGAVVDMVEDSIEDVGEKAKKVADVVGDKIEEAIEELKDEEE